MKMTTKVLSGLMGIIALVVIVIVFNVGSKALAVSATHENFQKSEQAAYTLYTKEYADQFQMLSYATSITLNSTTGNPDPQQIEYMDMLQNQVIALSNKAYGEIDPYAYGQENETSTDKEVALALRVCVKDEANEVVLFNQYFQNQSDSTSAMLSQIEKTSELHANRLNSLLSETKFEPKS